MRDALPENAFDFQATLGNGRRVDCLLRLPNPPGPIAIDSKFPLEAYRRLTSAANDAERDAAKRLLENDVKKHIQDIAEKYIIPGETAESAILFYRPNRFMPKSIFNCQSWSRPAARRVSIWRGRII